MECAVTNCIDGESGNGGKTLDGSTASPRGLSFVELPLGFLSGMH
jgi:hypothetical protein